MNHYDYDRESERVRLPLVGGDESPTLRELLEQQESAHSQEGMNRYN